ncbi:hypothetical protein I553_6247 [Mycobacterium xenopi 4042]|uniref:Uncharacterized protein n=1 Tax=Mycobacterium xenopi 4042 TaxID=1299334 RepID=X8BE42_MYCXE|nr:hypothetical protein I553_6247 [Mycobacterium xenopi 4042]
MDSAVSFAYLFAGRAVSIRATWRRQPKQTNSVTGRMPWKGAVWLLQKAMSRHGAGQRA